jgi:hypothetical protein
MRGKLAIFLLFAAGLSSPGQARPVSMVANCKVVAGENYLGPDGGQAICAEIERAIAAVAPAARFSAEITALSAYRLAATMTVNGRRLPEHKFAVMDGALDKGSVQRFARALAADVAKAAKK